jgi:hypothetical protein
MCDPISTCRNKDRVAMTHHTTPTEQQPRTHTPDRINPDGSTTIKMKRACNGCGQHLGDVTEQEMACGINGLPLPDVRKECPTCAPTAPEPKCVPTHVLSGDTACLEFDCGHDREDGADYCDQVDEHHICVTHSVIGKDGTITRSAPWPCEHGPARLAAVLAAVETDA